MSGGTRKEIEGWIVCLCGWSTGTEGAREGPARARRSKRTEGAWKKKAWRWKRGRKPACLSLATDAVQMRPVLQDLARRLREACEAGDAGAVRDLVGAKADVNERDVMSDFKNGCLMHLTSSFFFPTRRQIQFYSS